MSDDGKMQYTAHWREGGLLAAVMLAAALLLTGLNGLTQQRSAEARQQPLRVALAEVFPSTLHDNDLLAAAFSLQPGSDSTLLGLTSERTGYRATQGGRPSGVILPLETRGYGGPIVLLIGIDASGTITGVRVQQHAETSGLGDKLELALSPWIRSFNNRSLANTPAVLWRVKREGGDFDQFVGATITPRAVVAAIHAALQYFEANHEQLLQGAEP